MLWNKRRLPLLFLKRFLWNKIHDNYAFLRLFSSSASFQIALRPVEDWQEESWRKIEPDSDKQQLKEKSEIWRPNYFIPADF